VAAAGLVSVTTARADEIPKDAAQKAYTIAITGVG
jgi:hypothetical protein